MSDCFSCRQSAALDDLPIRERIFWDGHWRVAHAFNSALQGWLVVIAARHVRGLAELDADESAALGPLLAALSRALVEVTGCEKTYLMLFAELEAFAHLHIHLVPRQADLPDELRAARIFDYLGRPESEWVPAAEMDRIGAAVAERLVSLA